MHTVERLNISRRQALYPRHAGPWSGGTKNNLLRVLLPGTEDAIARIPQSWNDIAILIEMAVYRCGIDMHIGMVLFNGGNAFGRRHQHQGAHIAAARLLQKIDGGDHGA